MIHTEPEIQKLSAAYEVVQRIGDDLDRQVFARVTDGGLMLPAGADDLHQLAGREKRDVERKRRPATGSWQGAAGGQRKAGGPWTAGTAPSAGRRSSAADYEEELTKLKVAYPASQVWMREQGIWLVAHSALVDGLDREAVFVVALPFDVRKSAQGWGFWSRGNLAFVQWIGPRHTNFPFGSICAFEPADGTWRTGDSPIVLLDLYSLWAVRHLHLEHFGRWPGSQVARWPYERRTECLEHELCGCGSFSKTYAECCLPLDRKRDAVKDALSFIWETGGGDRSPPIEIFRFLREQIEPPQVTDYT